MQIPTLSDPRTLGSRPPFSEPKQTFPGSEATMQLKPDHGETSYVGSGKLSGRRALITGGDSGIGAAVAVAFAREGASVVISHLPEEQSDADRVIRLIQNEGRIGSSIPADIRNESACEALVEQTQATLGGLDILVNNAGYQKGFTDIAEITEQELEQAFRTNVYGTFFLCKAAAPNMPPGSCVINTTSIQSYDPSASLLPYAATKGAVTNLTKSLSRMLIEKGIRVNAVAPGPVWSPLNPMAMPSVEHFGEQSPTGRPAQPAELAPVYVLLASNEASYITGAIYEVTGGMLTA